jgi:hypothetical protein
VFFQLWGWQAGAVAALALLLLRFILWPLTPREIAADQSTSKASPLVRMLVGSAVASFFVVATGYYASMLPADMRDASAYHSDSSCTAGATLPADASSGLCTQTDVAVRATSESYGRGIHYYLGVHASADNVRTIEIGQSSANMAVWHAAQTEPLMPGQAQFFDGRVAQVTTSAGTAVTLDHPDQRLIGHALWTAFGALTIAVSVLVFLRRPRGLAPAPLLESG